MGVDFDALVLNPTVTTFGILVTFTPLVSQPLAASYDSRGVFSSTPLDVLMQDDTIFSDQQTSLGVRYRDFPVAPPAPGDLVTITDPAHWAFGKQYWIGDSDDDGQGGTTLLLRLNEPPT